VIPERISALVAASATAPAADRATLHAYLASDPDTVQHDLVAALAELDRDFTWTNAIATAWTVAHLADGDVCADFDELVRSALREWNGTYDLLGGLVGFGVYALERQSEPLARGVLDELERRVVERGGGLAWFTQREIVPVSQRTLAPHGYWNLGLAHGIPGVVALLARFVRDGVDVSRSRALLAGGVRYLLGVERGRDGYPYWEADVGETRTTARIGWCYGDLGVALALLAAGIHASEPMWRAAGLALARSCASRGLEFDDASFCHGAAGNAHIFDCMARATGDEVLAAASQTWLARALTASTDEDTSLIGGSAGIALVLHARISETVPAWDRRLLVDMR
jgi:hypothetical protein